MPIQFLHILISKLFSWTSAHSFSTDSLGSITTFAYQNFQYVKCEHCIIWKVWLNDIFFSLGHRRETDNTRSIEQRHSQYIKNENSSRGYNKTAKEFLDN